MGKRRVVVWGTSLNLAGIAASLKTNPTLEVIGVDPNTPASRQALDELAFAVIVFDRCEASNDLVASLLRERPGLLMIGVDPSSDEMLVLSGRPVQALSLSDLVNVIERQASTSKAFERNEK